MDADLERRLRAAVDALPRGLRDHILRVETAALSLAETHHVDPDRVELAVLGHDLARGEPPARLLALAGQYGLDPDEVERGAPILLHGPVAARILAEHYGVSDAEALAAVACHTTACPGMTVLEKVLFLADKVEPEKIARRPEWQEVGDLARADLDAALLRFLDLQIERALERGWRIHPRTLAARNGLLPPESAQG